MALFRDEVIEAKRAQQQGSLLIATPPSVRWIAIAGLVFLGAIAAVLFFVDYGIRVCPAIYQAVVDKVCDLRVTVIGRRVFTARIVRHDGVSPLDWRPASVLPGELVMDAYELDETTQASVLRLMDALALRYGCVDLAVDRQGDVYFFEINTGGQFLFIDDHIPDMNLLGEMAGFLLAGSLDYRALPREIVSLAAFERTERCASLLSCDRRFRQSDRMITRIHGEAAAA